MSDRPISRGTRSVTASEFSESRPATAGGFSRPMTGGVQMPLPFQRPETRQGDGSSRPSTSGRPLTARPVSSGLRGAPGTASRLISTAAVQRPGSRTGVATGIGINTQINVYDRPITQQGISGMKTGSRGHQRQVQDKSYYMGLLRTKTSSLVTETTRLKKDIDEMKQEQSSFLTYDKKVKEVAQELTELQGTLADHNMLVDLMNTDTEQSEVNEDVNELKEENDQQMAKLDTLFSQKQEKEKYMRQLENEIEEERHMGENLIAAMLPDLREKYLELRNLNGAFLQRLDVTQQEIDNLDTKRQTLEDELSMSKVKQEAVHLFTRLRDLEEKRDEIVQESQKRGTPQEERDKLILQVKEDNTDIATMERQMGEVTEDIARANEEMHQLEQELDENKSERSQKYRELKKREEAMEQFMETFEDNRRDETNRLKTLENNIVDNLERISRNLSYFGNLPSTTDFSSLKGELSFKKGELQKSQYTESSLKSEHLNLQANLQRIEALETKVEKEKVDLKNKLEKMEKEYQTFSDINGLKRKMEEKRIQLAGEKDDLELKKQTVAQSLKDITNQINVVKKQLSENETHSQLQNHEKKWAHLEQNNFVMKEFIAQKRAESNFIPLKNQAMNLVMEYNQNLQNLYQSGGSIS